ncbi:MAG TPA: hypothetical protein VME44_16745 [Streptosporangiaceae bacterium]|nr:hypothetical protein [Streptosporangiaceae bacterium]
MLPSASVNRADYLPAAVGYGQTTATATAWPPGAHSRVGSAGNAYPASDDYDGSTGYGGSAGYGGAAEPDWGADPDELPWQESQDWQNWGPPPELHPDHPSAPVPRIQFPADHPSGPMPAAVAPSASELPQRHPGGQPRTWGPRPRTAEAASGNRRLYAVPDGASATEYTANAPRTGYRNPGPARLETADYRRETVGYRRQPGPGWQETTDYRREPGPSGPDSGPAGGRFKDFRNPNAYSRAPAGQPLEVHHGDDRQLGRASLADSRAAQVAIQAQIAQQAQEYAASLRESAEREAVEITRLATDRANVITEQATGQAAAIREAVEREAAELRARLETMTGELGRVTAFLTENLAPSTRPTAAPALPDASPAPPGTFPPMPETRPARPQTQPGTRPLRPGTSPGAKPAKPGTGLPARPATSPGARPASPARPKTTPARPSTTPAKIPQTQGRQRRAMFIATAGTAALLSIAAAGAITYTGIHGFSFFVFRESGQGETPGNFTDANFVAGQKECRVGGLPAVCPAPHHDDSAPKGRHHKTTASK